MIRDGVCDEVANIKTCLFDGGDCCKEHKDEGLCRDCECILEVNQGELVKQFESLEIKPVRHPESLDIAVQTNNNRWTVEVKYVVSVQVCSVLCLEHELADELNAWHYLIDEKNCRCGWVHSASWPEKMIIKDWRLDNETDSSSNNDGPPMPNAFVQLQKTVPLGRIQCAAFFCMRSHEKCRLLTKIFHRVDCLATGFLINGVSSENAKVAYGDNIPFVLSLWHCLELCRIYQDCAWVSWRKSQENWQESGIESLALVCHTTSIKY